METESGGNGQGWQDGGSYRWQSKGNVWPQEGRKWALEVTPPSALRSVHAQQRLPTCCRLPGSPSLVAALGPSGCNVLSLEYKFQWSSERGRGLFVPRALTLICTSLSFALAHKRQRTGADSCALSVGRRYPAFPSPLLGALLCSIAAPS